MAIVPQGLISTHVVPRKRLALFCGILFVFRLLLVIAQQQEHCDYSSELKEQGNHRYINHLNPLITGNIITRKRGTKMFECNL